MLIFIGLFVFSVWPAFDDEVLSLILLNCSFMLPFLSEEPYLPLREFGSIVGSKPPLILESDAISECNIFNTFADELVCALDNSLFVLCIVAYELPPNDFTYD